jgi:GDP-L-fucose synthase
LEFKDKIFIAGHRGMVGSAILRNLQSKGFTNIITHTSAELDLRDQQAVNNFFQKEKPLFVFLAAARVGGIHANNVFRAEFIYDNLMIEANVIHAAYKNKAEKLFFLGSSCIYPKLAPQPLKEESLLTGPLELTNEPYAIAKIAGIKLCDAYRAQYGCNFISAMPTNLYGPNDNYHPVNSHVLPALLRKIIIAKRNNDPSVTMWGTGLPRREFLYVDDLANACIYLMQNYNEQGFVNIGTGKDLTIMELANLIKEIVDYKGTIETDTSKPDGTPQKLLDVTKLKGLGWQASITLEKGIRMVYEDVKDNNWE